MIPRGSAKVFPLGIRPDHLTHRFAKLAKAAGVHCSLHDLRRTFASRLAPHVPAQVLMRLCRHRSISVTMRYYANLEDGLHDAIAKVS